MYSFNERGCTVTITITRLLVIKSKGGRGRKKEGENNFTRFNGAQQRRRQSRSPLRLTA